MNNKENIKSLLRREGYEWMPPSFNLCPSLEEKFKEKYGDDKDYYEVFNFGVKNIPEGILADNSKEKYLKYYPEGLKEGTHIDTFGVAHEPGSEAAKHMTRMICPLRNAESVEEILNYEFPDYKNADYSKQQELAKKYNEEGYFLVGSMQMTVWETSWYIRGMENLMMDMMSEDEMADAILDKVTEIACIRAENFAKSGVDMIFLGDDIGMQKTIMMSEELYRTWLKPRIKKVIDSARKINPDVIIAYHSCGYVKPFIQDLIDVGVDVLNPIQPECMDFEDIFNEFGGKISFHGTVGTQTTMPFGTPEEVREVVFRNLKIAGEKGGLWVSPTHLLEPEVPWENIEAYMQACKDYKDCKQEV